MEITSKLVADLRAETGVGMMDCKKALVEAGGDFEEARKILRKRGLAAAARKADRATSEGLVMARVTAKAAARRAFRELHPRQRPDRGPRGAPRRRRGPRQGPRDAGRRLRSPVRR